MGSRHPVDREEAQSAQRRLLPVLGLSFTACWLLVSAGLVPAAAGADEPVPAATPPAVELANANTVALLAEARDALARLDSPPPGDEPGQAKIYFDTAADCLTALYQLHGCAWAGPALQRLYARPAAPQLRLGHSPDGRVLLRVEPLELTNPAFAGYTVLLCSFGSQTARDVRDTQRLALALRLPDGTPLLAEAVDEQHPLWDQLQRVALQYAPPPDLPSGAGISWKQLYAIPQQDLALNDCALSLDWGGYHFELPRWTGLEGGAGDG
jgi:hypothetical protein